MGQKVSAVPNKQMNQRPKSCGVSSNRIMVHQNIVIRAAQSVKPAAPPIHPKEIIEIPDSQEIIEIKDSQELVWAMLEANGVLDCLRSSWEGPDQLLFNFSGQCDDRPLSPILGMSSPKRRSVAMQEQSKRVTTVANIVAARMVKCPAPEATVPLLVEMVESLSLNIETANARTILECAQRRECPVMCDAPPVSIAETVRQSRVSELPRDEEIYSLICTPPLTCHARAASPDLCSPVLRDQRNIGEWPHEELFERVPWTQLFGAGVTPPRVEMLTHEDTFQEPDGMDAVLVEIANRFFECVTPLSVEIVTHEDPFHDSDGMDAVMAELADRFD